MAKTIKLINENAYNVFILPQARTKMELYCALCEKEIGWLGFVKRYEDNSFLIEDVVLLKQEVHATTTEIDPTALLDFWGQTPVEKQPDIKLWGHSHVNIAPNPSGQDDNQMSYFRDGNPWFIRLITNKKGDINITIYDYANGYEIHSEELYTYDPNRLELKKAIMEEMKEKVTEKTYTPAKLPAKNTFTPPINKKTSKKTEAMFEDIDVKYVSKFDDVLNDPNYWQSILD